MAISTQIQNLNLIPGKSAPVVVHLSQGNVGDTVKFYLYDGDNPYYPSGVTIAVHGIRSDGTAFGPYAVSITSGSNLVSFNIVSAMTSVYGAAIGELVITDGNENQVGSANFGMLIEETPYSSSVTYEDDLSIYQRILAYVQSFPATVTAQIDAERDARIAADAALKADLTHKKVIVIGDSYCDANRGGYTNGWYTVFVNTAGLTNGTTAFLYAKGGAGMVGAGQGKTFDNLLDDAIAAHTTDKDEITDVIVAGGANDCDSVQADINTAKDAFKSKVHTNFPNAILHVAMISGFISATRRKLLMNKVRYVYYYYLDDAKNVSVTNAHLPMMRMKNIDTDGVHPKTNGCREIGFLIANHFLTGNNRGIFGTFEGQACNLPATGDMSSALAMKQDVNENGYMIYTNHGASVSFSGSKSATHNLGVTFPVGKVSVGANNEMLVANAESTTDSNPVFAIPCTFLAYTGDSTLTWVPMFGSLIGVADSSYNVEWYFRAETSPKACTFTQGRFTDFRAFIQ